MQVSFAGVRICTVKAILHLNITQVGQVQKVDHESENVAKDHLKIYKFKVCEWAR